jgi:hypothetical protein
MPRVDLSDYELAHDLLPPVCAKCGEPATDRPTLKLYIADGWSGAVQVFGLVFGVFLFPPLMLFTLRFARLVEVRVPLCPAHRDDLARREWAERHYLFPVWTAAALLLELTIIVELVADGPGISCVGLFVVVMAALVAAGFIGRGRIGLAKPPRVAVRLSGVHPAFAAALTENRARDRVSNPDRRAGHGDVRDDYDDGLD